MTDRQTIRFWPGRAAHYAFAVAMMVAALAVRQAIEHAVGALPHYILFYPALMVVALAGGLGPGLLATATAALLADIWILPPVGRFGIINAADAVGLSLFCCMGVFMSVVAELFRRARRRAAAFARELALRESEATLRGILDATQESVWVFSPEGRILAANKTALERFGKTAGEVTGRLMEEILPPGLARARQARLREVLKTGAPVEFEDRRADLIFHHSFYPIFDTEGRVITVVSFSRDITGRKLAEAELRQSREWLGVTLASIGDAVMTCDPAGRITFINPVAEALTGWTLDDALNHPIQEVFRIINERTRQPAEDIIARVLREGCVVELANHTALLARDGREIPIEDSAAPIKEAAGAIIGVVLVFHDVTERRRAEGRLRESEARHRNLYAELEAVFAAIQDTVLIYDTEMKVRQVNRDFIPTYGFDPIGMNVHEIIARTHCRMADGRPLILSEQPTPRAARGEMIRNQQFLITGADGGERALETSSTPLREGEAVRGIVTVWHDITERKLAEEALRQREEELHELSQRLTYHMDNSPLAVIEWGADMRLTRWSGDAERIFGWTAAEVLGKRMEDFRWIYHEDTPQVAEVSTDLVTGANPRRFSANRNYRKDGSVAWCEWYNSSLVDENGQLRSILSLVLDVTDRTLAEAALREANAQLAEADHRKNEFLAMLAHELRNPLAPVRNAVQILRLTGPADNPVVQRNHEMIERQVGHMARLLDDLLDVSRVTRGKIQLRLERLDLRAVVAQAVEVAAHTLNGRLALHFQNTSDPLWIDGDLTRLEQVTGNLLGNAAKYTDEGEIRVALECRADEKRPWALLRVSDTGVGIGAEMLPRVFDMFAQADQSLERTRGGLGIGLTMVDRLVRMHGGHVEVRSEGPGHGSEFTVWLPLAPDSADPGRPREAASHTCTKPVDLAHLQAILCDLPFTQDGD